ncbi:hypothetical protein H4219_001516 [Mycoemilia scoparia]|uniref:TLC domain-containing protein n=1 Tax=Mycoemilia scoparia TaxID=417184 RepID=A0A9W8A5Q7_9FUNG|nr:hypothetical protein H4219_001516 [Mycoemilia scoparia]
MLQLVLSALKTNPTGQPFFDFIGLPVLSRFWPYVVISALFFHTVTLVSDPISRLIFGAAYTKLAKPKKYSWSIRVASHIHAMYALIALIPLFYSEPLNKDRVFGQSDYASLVNSVVCGPCVQYYGPRFLLLELTTIPLNNHWFMEKLGIAGLLPTVNGAILMVSYFFIRVIYSTYLSYHIFADLAAAGDLIPTWLYYMYRVANTTSCLLNYYWFYKLMQGFIRRLGNKEAPAKTLKQQ